MTRLVMVTGHTFGVRAFEGIFSSAAYLDGQLEVPLVIGLSMRHATATAGFDSPWPLTRSHGCGFELTADGGLTSLAADISAVKPDYLLVVGWSRLIPADVLAIPGCGGIGMHPSPLPVGRGRAPIPWTIIKGLKQTALSVFFLADGADTGPLIARYPMSVRPRETSASLFSRMAVQHFAAGLELAPALAGQAVAGVPQAGEPDVWPKRTPADSRILPSMTRAEADALVRAQLGPYPRAFVSGVGNVRAVSAEPVPGSFPFRCADGIVHLTRDAQ